MGVVGEDNEEVTASDYSIQTGLIGILDVNIEISFQYSSLVGMSDVSSVTTQHKAIEHAFTRHLYGPHIVVEETILLLQQMRHEVQRQVGSQDSH